MTLYQERIRSRLSNVMMDIENNSTLFRMISIFKFAETEGLQIEIREREHPQSMGDRFYVYFKNAEILDNEIFLWGAYGNGATPECAVRDYARKISGRILVVNAWSEKRKQINIPKLY